MILKEKKTILITAILVASTILAANYFKISIFNLRPSAGGERGTIDLLPSVSANPGDEFETPVMVSSTAPVSALDVVINFDTSSLELLGITPKPENSGLQNFVPSLNSVVVQANSSGKVEFGVLGPETLNPGTLGPTNPLAVLRFRAKMGTPSIIFVEYNPGSTTDSNLANSQGEDILAGVTNLAVNGGGLKVGDINRDNQVDIIDFGILVDNFGTFPPQNQKADLNQDGLVDIIDFGLLVDHFGQ